MKNLHTKQIAFKLILSLIIATSCVKDTIDFGKISSAVTWDPTLGIPIAYGQLGMKNIIEAFDSTGFINEDADGFLSLYYRNHLFSQDASNLVNIPFQQFNEDFAYGGVGFPVMPIGATLTYSKVAYYDFSVGADAAIDSILIKSGLMSIVASSTFKQPAKLVIVFDKLTKNGVPLQLTLDSLGSLAPYKGTRNDARSLEGYKLSLDSATSKNKLKVSYTLTINNSPAQLLNGDEKVSIDLQLPYVTFQTLYGYIGTLNVLDMSDKTKIELFQNKNNTNVVLRDPMINLYISNSFGVPIEIKMDNTYTFSEKTNSQFPIIFSPAINPRTIKYPTGAQVPVTTDTFRYNKTTVSNLDAAIATAPQYFYYQVIGTSNPLGNTGVPNFISDTSKLNVDVEVQLPLDLKAESLILNDTISFPLDSLGFDLSILKRLAVYTSFTNGMPIDVALQVVFADSNYVHVDSLYTFANQPILASGTVDANGIVTQPTSKETMTLFDDTRSNSLKRARFAIVSANLGTFDKGKVFVKFFKSYKIDVAFKIQAELQVRSLNQF